MLARHRLDVTQLVTPCGLELRVLRLTVVTEPLFTLGAEPLNRFLAYLAGGDSILLTEKLSLSETSMCKEIVLPYISLV